MQPWTAAKEHTILSHGSQPRAAVPSRDSDSMSPSVSLGAAARKALRLGRAPSASKLVTALVPVARERSCARRPA